MDPRFFLPCFHGPRASRLGHKKEGKNSVHNLPYGPRTRLIRGYSTFNLLHQIIISDIDNNDQLCVISFKSLHLFSGFCSYFSKLARKTSLRPAIATQTQPES